MSLVATLSSHPQIAAALQQASLRTGTDFDYLLKTAMRESSLDCSAKSGTSSACGLFQFTEQSWLGTLRRNGEALGYGSYAHAITQDDKGRYRVADPAARQAILALRNDPTASAMMAGAYTSESESALNTRLGRDVSEGELYIAHFLGAGGAGKLITAAEDMPHVRADTLFPQAAAANRSIFYEGGRAKTVGEVYQSLVARHDDTQVARLDLSSLAPAPQASRAPTDSVEADSVEADAAHSMSDAWTPSDTSPISFAPVFRPISGNGLPAHSASGASSHLSRSPLIMTPAVVEILSSLNPIPESRDATSVAARKEDEADARRRRLALAQTQMQSAAA